jgi:PAS domain S-box-containing protein
MNADGDRNGKPEKSQQSITFRTIAGMLNDRPALRAVLITLGIFIFIFLPVWWVAGVWYEELLIKEERAQVETQLVPYGNALTSTVNERFALLEGLGAFIQTHPTEAELKDSFEPFASGLYSNKKGIRAIQVFPRGAIAERVYPMAGNEAVLKGNFTTLVNDDRPSVHADVQQTIALHRLTASAPNQLRQGGLGLVARLAIYQNESLWGLTSLVLDVPPILASAGLSGPHDDLDMALRDNHGGVFYGSNTTFTSDPVIYSVPVGDKTWELAAVPKGGWSASVQGPLLAFRLAGLIIIGLLACLMFLVINRQAQLAESVRMRTADLARSEERYRMLVETIPEKIFVKDTHSTYVSCNEHYARDLGIAAEAIAGKTDFDFFPHDLAENYQIDDRAVMESGAIRVIEERYISEGKESWISTLKTPLRDAAGNVTGILGIFHDITERKQAEEELSRKHEELMASYEQITAAEEELRESYDELARSGKALQESEAYIKAVLDNLPIGIAVNSVDPAIVFTYMNNNFPKFYRTTREDLGDPDAFWDVAYEDPAFRKTMKKRVLDDCAGGDPARMYWADIPLTRKDDKTTFVTARNIPLPDKQLMISTVMDVTERKEAEMALRKSEEEYRSLFDNMLEGFAYCCMLYDAKGQPEDWIYLNVNASFNRIIGTTTIINKRITEAFPGIRQDIPEIFAIYGRVALTGKPEVFDLDFRAIGKWLHISVYSPEKEHFVAIFEDITERKLAELELLEAHRDLEKKVIERTRELSDANERLKELDQLKSLFIASMSHELRTPLNSIIGFTGIMVKGMTGEINPEQKKQLGMVQDSARHLLALINDVIDISKIEAGKIEVNVSTFDLAKVLLEIRNTIATAAAEQGLILNIEISTPVPVASDERRIKQIILNLVSNAIKFSDEGRVDVTVQQKADRVEICVRDTGIGIRQEDLAQLFRPFARVQVPGRLTEGTGLGLYLSQKLALFLGGNIAVKSELHKGSAFVFSFPVVYVKQEEV